MRSISNASTLEFEDLKVDISEAKIDENFANYFLKPKLTTIVLYSACKGLQKSIKSKPKTLQSRPCLKS